MPRYYFNYRIGGLLEKDYDGIRNHGPVVVDSAIWLVFFWPLLSAGVS